MKSNQEIISNLCASLIYRIGELSPNQVILNDAEVENIITRQYRIFQNRHDSRIFFGFKPEYSEQGYWDNLSLNIIKVIANLTDEIKNSGREIGLIEIQKSLKKCLVNTNISQWLRAKLLDHLPPLFLKELLAGESNEDGQSQSDKYYVFLKGEKIIEYNKHELEKFKQTISINNYDIFIENTNTQRIFVHNNPKVFRAGKYHAFSILSLFLQKSGKSISYNEIYHLAIKPLEKVHPRDRSKKVYDYLKRIDSRVGQASKADKTAEKWFSRVHKKGIVQISNKINACLIISLDKLAG